MEESDWAVLFPCEIYTQKMALECNSDQESLLKTSTPVRACNKIPTSG